jgi:hypothetical protein
MKNKKYHTVGTVPKAYRNIIERGTNDTPNTQIHDRSLSWFDTNTSLKSGGVKRLFWVSSLPC